jgi:hypothetical protein
MRQIGQLATQVERFLAKRRGTIECSNDAVDLTVGPGVRYGVTEKELLNTFAERRVVSFFLWQVKLTYRTPSSVRTLTKCSSAPSPTS